MQHDLKCPSCNTVQPKSDVCVQCKSALPTAGAAHHSLLHPDAGVYCPACATENPISHKFCFRCSTDLYDRRATNVQPAHTSGPGGKQPVKIIRCPRCGIEQAFSNSCSNCKFDIRQFVDELKLRHAPVPPAAHAPSPKELELE